MKKRLHKQACQRPTLREGRGYRTGSGSDRIINST
jgi:hypothetical protein